MTNNEMFTQSYTDLVEALYDLTSNIKNSSDWEEIAVDIDIANNLTTILKRMGETGVLENGQEANETSKEEVVVEEKIDEAPQQKKRGRTKKEVGNTDGNI